ncbi:hypothetical protein FQR65_LT04661 [Abscondita terminalis]|nr:hypothetical protein FQR65_LT04661 [Abscondita terminalis]
MYKLGQLLRKKYEGFLSDYYFPDLVQVRSSASDRCIMSAQVLAAGLFPPVQEQIWNPDLLWQPIPVNYLPKNRDNVIALRSECPKYAETLKQVYMSPRIKKINDENKNLYNYLSKVTGGNINDVNAVEYLYNTLVIEKRNNLTLPEWINDTLLHKLEEFAVLNYAIFSDNTLMKRLSGGGFLKEALSYVTAKINKTSNINIVLYSGHDVTIVSITRSLGFENEFSKPEYGAYIVLELYENQDNEYEIEFLYGNNYESSPKKFEMKFCASPCTVMNFINGYDDVLPKDWENECAMHKPTFA